MHKFKRILGVGVQEIVGKYGYSEAKDRNYLRFTKKIKTGELCLVVRLIGKLRIIESGIEFYQPDTYQYLNCDPGFEGKLRDGWLIFIHQRTFPIWNPLDISLSFNCETPIDEICKDLLSNFAKSSEIIEYICKDLDLLYFHLSKNDDLAIQMHLFYYYRARSAISLALTLGKSSEISIIIDTYSKCIPDPETRYRFIVQITDFHKSLILKGLAPGE